MIAALAVTGCGDRAAEAAGDTSAAFVVDSATLSSISLDSVTAVGRAAYDAGSWNEAEAIWAYGLDRAREEGASSSEAFLLTLLGLVSYQRGEFERAHRLELEALAVEEEFGHAEHMPRTFNALGLITWEMGRLDEAATWYDSTFRAARDVGDDSYYAKALVNLGLLETSLGDLRSAREHMHEGLEAFRGLGDSAMESRTLTNLAALERDAGNLDLALGHARKALDVARALDDADVVTEEAPLGQLASLYVLLGRHHAALTTVDSALQRARAAGLRPAEAANLEILAGVHRQLGDLTRALRLYDSARAINLQLESRPYETGLDLYHMAEIQAALGNLDVARERAERARAIHGESGWTTAELSDLLLLSEIEQLAGEVGRSDEHLAAARSLADELGLVSTRLDLALTEARIAEHRGDDDRLLSVLDEVEADLLIAGFAAEAEAAAMRARALARRGDAQAAELAARRAIALVARERSDLNSGVFRSMLAHGHAAAYAVLVDILLEQERTEDAFAVAAAARPGFRVFSTGTEDLRDEIDRLARQIRDTELQTWNPDMVGQPVARLRRARTEFESAALSPEHLRGSGGGEPFAASVALRARAALGPGEALLHYLVGDERGYVFLVTADGVTAARLDADTEVLSTRVRLARRLLRSPAAGDADEVLEALHADLLAPLFDRQALDRVERLYVIPHGVITYLPFAALRDPATGRYLVQDRVVHYLPSVPPADAGSIRTRIASQRTQDRSGVVFAPLPDSLPASLEEARAVAATFSGGARLLIGEEASEAAVRAALTGGAYVHIASHAELNAANPLYSDIRLAASAIAGDPGDTGDAGSDGRLDVREIFDLSISSPLVFLSGCETGLGAGWSSSFAAGEDFATLERALLEAGAGSVIATLWRIEDRSAADFATRFYRQLAGSDAATALAEAQREMIAEAGTAHPFHWASYRVGGSAWHD